MRMGLPLFVSCCFLPGCAGAPARIHGRFQELCPRQVQVQVENRTLQDNLDRYTTGGLLQRTIFGPGDSIDIPGEFRRSAEKILEQSGYQVAAGAASPGAPTATLHLRLLSWSRLPAHEGAGVEGEFEVELIEPAAGESLYFQSGRHRSSSHGSPGSGVSSLDLERGVRSAVARVLRELPPFGVSRTGAG